LERVKEEFSSKLNAAEQVEETLKQQIAELTTVSDQFGAEIAEHKLAENRLQQDRKEFELLLEQQDAELATAKEQLQQQEQQLEQTNQQLRRQSIEHTETEEQFRKRNTELTAQSQALKEQTAILGENVKQLEKRRKQAEKQLHQQNNELAAARKELGIQVDRQLQAEKVLTQRITELGASNDQLRSQAAEYERAAKRLQQRSAQTRQGAIAIGQGNQQTQTQEKYLSKIDSMLDWPKIQSVHSSLRPKNAVGQSNQAKNRSRKGARRYAIKPVTSPEFSRNYRRVITAAAAVVIVFISLGIYNIVNEGSGLWGQVLSLSLSGTTTRSVGVVTGILISEKKPCAMVGTQLVHEGDIVRGVTIAAIQKDKIVFEKDGMTWTQQLHEIPSVNWETTISAPNSVSE
jgi:hypothetical protein